MKRVICLFGLCAICLFGCYRKVCPAYASAFILNDTLRHQLYSPFGYDSMPRPFVGVRKTKNHLVAKRSDRRKSRSLQTLVAKRIYAGPPKLSKDLDEPTEPVADTLVDLKPVPDTLTVEEESLPKELTEDDDVLPSVVVQADSLAETVEDTPIDTLGPEDLYRYGYDPADNFNVDQVFYNKHFGHLFLKNAPPEEVDTTAVLEEEEFDVVPEAYDEQTYLDETEGVEFEDEEEEAYWDEEEESDEF